MSKEIERKFLVKSQFDFHRLNGTTINEALNFISKEYIFQFYTSFERNLKSMQTYSD